SAALWWSAVLPPLNPFEGLYNRTIAVPNGRSLLTPAPPPRRFAAAMAGAFLLTIGMSLLLDSMVSAYVSQPGIVMSGAALSFAKFCPGAYTYHLLRGQSSFANGTLPWVRSR